MQQVSFHQSSMTIGFPHVPEAICVLSDCGSKERPDRLVNSKTACGTRPGGAAVGDEAGGKDDSGDECESARNTASCGGQ